MPKILSSIFLRFGDLKNHLRRWQRKQGEAEARFWTNLKQKHLNSGDIKYQWTANPVTSCDRFELIFKKARLLSFFVFRIPAGPLWISTQQMIDKLAHGCNKTSQMIPELDWEVIRQNYTRRRSRRESDYSLVLCLLFAAKERKRHWDLFY